MKRGEAIGWLWRLAGLTLALTACSSGQESKEEARSEGLGELSAAVSVPRSHDIASFEFKVLEAGSQCSDPALKEARVALETGSRPAPVSGGGAGPNHAFADSLFVLQPGEYLVCAAPLRADGTPSLECSQASSRQTVLEGATAEAVLISNCAAEGSGGLEPVAIVNDPPRIDGLVIEPSKSVAVHERITITVSASDVNGDALRIDAAVLLSPPRAEHSIDVSGASIRFVPGSEGEYQLKVTASDIYGASASMIVPIHVSSAYPGGTVWAWGSNGSGQLGHSAAKMSAVPVQVKDLTGVVAIAGGDWHGMALDSTGIVWSWGRNREGQLGDGTMNSSSMPARVKDLMGVVAIAGGCGHGMALDSTGRVWTWGANDNGQLGDGTTNASSAPVQVKNLADVTAIAGGCTYSMALDSTGRVWAWGSNRIGDPGDGSTLRGSVPAQVKDLTGVVAIAGNHGHSMALDSTGRVWAWGSNWNGELGDGTTNDSPTPVQVKDLSGVVAIAGSCGHNMALDSTGRVWAWGLNGRGALGDGTTDNSSVPVQVKNLSGVVTIAGGCEHSMALDSTGRVWAWGSNLHGELGDSFTFGSSTPVLMSNNHLFRAVAITGGRGFSLALDSDGRVWAWGDNDDGELGDGTINRVVPNRVSDIAGITSIAAGEQHSLALDLDGRAWSWGDNFSWQLGDGTAVSGSGPVQVSDLAGLTAIAAGAFYSMALDSGGRIWSWGNNSCGQLGDGSRSSCATLTQVSNLTTTVPAIVTGGQRGGA
jgi:alpha-tubulin suppressor-like RCC1 family protein